MNNHSTPIQGRRPDKRDLSTSSIDLVPGNKNNKISDLMENSETNQFHLSEADIDVISRKMRDLFKADVEAIVNSVVQSLIPQIISGINESLNTKITSLECENKVLKDQISELQVQADRA
ncbi:hypothetical protein DPMN_186375 [Dreissena polymorpha]|uniref:Uncharacterized protein n=1 Tax=Dreissena polymorpha TaxID=45954 RepID=A0A9D4DLG1_DREPO|nr:hypothetical protein DPMN_186375 [Dreissena polymorpha]